MLYAIKGSIYKSDTLKRPSKILAGYVGRELGH